MYVQTHIKYLLFIIFMRLFANCTQLNTIHFLKFFTYIASYPVLLTTIPSSEAICLKNSKNYKKIVHLIYISSAILFTIHFYHHLILSQN